MTVTTRPPAKGGNRLPRSGGGGRGREIRLGLLGVLGLLVLLVGIPVGLVLGVGYPLPRHAPSHDWLTAPVTATLIIKILACVVWLVWAHFFVCVLAEWRAVRHGRLPSHVAFGGSSQALARRLVAAVLLLSGAATTFSQVSGGPAAHRPAAISRPSSVAAGAAVAAGLANAAGAQQQDPGAAPSARASSPQQVKYYTVEPPHGRRHDCLWDIAERTLHDPLRWREIFELNKDRTQADGRKLVDANLIRPGWQLRLPGDAHGPGVHAAPSRPVAAPARPAEGSAPTTAPTAGSASVGSVAAGALGAAVAHPSIEHSQAPATAADGSAGGIGLELFGGALMLAGVLTALTARRGPYAESADEELMAGADPALAGLVDKALRHLALACREQGLALPPATVCWATHERVILSLGPGEHPAPPAPWVAGEDARLWDLEIAALPDGPAPDIAAPYPGLLSVGRSEGCELFLDLEQAPGVLSIAGELGRARDLVLALAVQAVTARWSDGAKVTAVGFGGEDLARIAPRSIVQVPTLADVLPEIEREHAQVRELQRSLGVDGVLTGRQARRSATWQPHLVLLSGPPTAEELARLNAVSPTRSSTAVIVLGDVLTAPWRFTVDAAGQLDLGALGLSAHAHRLSPEAAAHLVALLTGADDARLRASRRVGALSPEQARPTTPGRASRSAPTLPGVTESVHRQAPVVATVTLLGPVAVAAEGHVDPRREALATEIVVAAALAPDGLHDAALRASVWPRGVGDEVVEGTMASVQAWLGLDADGEECLRRGEDGLWRLGPGVKVDWDELQQLAAQGAGREEAALARAVDLFRGEAFSATPAGRYGWMAFARAAREARVLGTSVARRRAELLVAAGRRDDAVLALRRGLLLVPTAEPLWRELLTLTGGDGPDGAAAVAREMYATLRARRVWAEPETDALVASLVPGFDPDLAPAAAAG